MQDLFGTDFAGSRKPNTPVFQDFKSETLEDELKIQDLCFIFENATLEQINSFRKQLEFGKETTKQTGCKKNCSCQGR